MKIFICHIRRPFADGKLSIAPVTLARVTRAYKVTLCSVSDQQY